MPFALASVRDQQKMRRRWRVSDFGIAAYPALGSLLHFDGANASPAFVDETGKVWTANGNAQISTAQSQFGGASGYFDGSGDYLTTPNHSDFEFGSGDFTIEAFIRPNNITSNQTIISNWYGVSAVYCSFNVYISSDGKLLFSYGVGGTNAGTATTNSLVANVWQHIAICRSGTTVSFYIGGVKDPTTLVLSGSLNVPPGPAIAIGCISPSGSRSQYFNGYIDELRVTKGLARYSANFTPPAAPFSGF